MFDESPQRGTINLTPSTGPVLENAISAAVATLTESRVLSCPNSRASRYLLTTVPSGFGWDGSIRKADRVTALTFSTSHPPIALENAKGGFYSRAGVRNHEPTHAQYGQTQHHRCDFLTTNNSDRFAAACFLQFTCHSHCVDKRTFEAPRKHCRRATSRGNQTAGRQKMSASSANPYNNSVERHAAIENNLATALNLVRTGKSISDIQRATARAMRAATLLKQVCECTDLLKGGAV